MDNIKMKEKVGKSQVADLSIQETNPKKKQKLCESQVTPSPSLSKIDLAEAMKKQNDVAMFLAGKVISTLAKNSNLVFSPVSINAVLTMAANRREDKTLRSFILSFLRFSSTEELNAVFGEICSVVLADGSASGGPKIAALNGVWIDQSLSVDSSWQDLIIVNFFKAEFAQVDFSTNTKAEIVRMEVNAWALLHTNNLIKDLLPQGSVTFQTEWIYGNALYFKGSWENNHNNQYVKAYDDFKVLRLDYQQGRDDADRKSSMYFYLPDKRDGLDNLLKRLTSTHGFLDSHIPRYKDRTGIVMFVGQIFDPSKSD
ncbi:hypothetical protein F2Q70_00001489 [Brassica cretica]|uniref:Serpin domain-containing protein n=1 Tax=Brassica cretica TaxID=69181 RepID=A0A8S9IKS8_BRACR|nr:hypothetical protein F2Q70_00001489 [Brassica cretica]